MIVAVESRCESQRDTGATSSVSHAVPSRPDPTRDVTGSATASFSRPYPAVTDTSQGGWDANPDAARLRDRIEAELPDDWPPIPDDATPYEVAEAWALGAGVLWNAYCVAEYRRGLWGGRA